MVNLWQEGQKLDFLGYSFGREYAQRGGQRYWTMRVSDKALAREREKLREMTSPSHCWKPLPMLIAELNRHLKGWANYFNRGYSKPSFGRIKWYVQQRLHRHLRRRSQRPWKCPEDKSLYTYLKEQGLIHL